MNTNLSGGSAQIYQFPQGGRAALGGHRYEEYVSEIAMTATPRINEAACDGSWYHEAAILESKPAGGH
jgi:hypothetical protein